MSTIAAVIAVAAAAEAPTTTDTPAEGAKKEEKPAVLPCISAKIREALANNARQRHHLVLQGLLEVGQKPLFNDKFGECVREDYKLLDQQARLLCNQSDDLAWNTYAAEIKAKIQGVVDTHMGLAREDKAEWDKLSPRLQARNPFCDRVEIPFADLKACFSGKEDAHIVVELVKLFPVNEKARTGVCNIGTAKAAVWALKVPFVPAPVATVEAAPESGEAPKSAAA